MQIARSKARKPKHPSDNFRGYEQALFDWWEKAGKIQSSFIKKKKKKPSLHISSRIPLSAATPARTIQSPISLPNDKRTRKAKGPDFTANQSGADGFRSRTKRELGTEIR
ncbi:hypothetical protein EUGRSUZ_E00808 [Eucalyptus grandis]|uniref:Uncharacterized protein n=2 Tax=Eucalyptus grandis TaxID=71139 RepID=A0A059C274_EUCGR|nr:hypothetical protein EUGRSUZ_E00808 [Eucalyptus grandis]